VFAARRSEEIVPFLTYYRWRSHSSPKLISNSKSCLCHGTHTSTNICVQTLFSGPIWQLWGAE